MSALVNSVVFTVGCLEGPEDNKLIWGSQSRSLNISDEWIVYSSYWSRLIQEKGRCQTDNILSLPSWPSTAFSLHLRIDLDFKRPFSKDPGELRILVPELTWLSTAISLYSAKGFQGHSLTPASHEPSMSNKLHSSLALKEPPARRLFQSSTKWIFPDGSCPVNTHPLGSLFSVSLGLASVYRIHTLTTGTQRS